jgi:hypothetical protein
MSVTFEVFSLPEVAGVGELAANPDLDTEMAALVEQIDSAYPPETERELAHIRAAILQTARYKNGLSRKNHLQLIPGGNIFIRT